MNLLFTRFLTIFILLLVALTTASADEFSWGNTYAQAWQGFGTSPYSAKDTATGKSITIFCLDFNDDIAPPFTWNANAWALNPNNVTNQAQYGGNYNNLLNQAYGASHPGQPAPNQIAAAPFTFVMDDGGSGYKVDLSQSINDPYARYVEAAWLFSELEAAGVQSKLALVAQVAAWDLFVNVAHAPALAGDIAATNANGKIYGFQDLVGGSGMPSVSGLDFQQAVDYMLSAAQQAVTVNRAFTGAGWSIVTADAGWVESSSGKTIPAQEFLSPDAGPITVTTNEVPPVPEPSAVILLGTVIAALALVAARASAAPTVES